MRKNIEVLSFGRGSQNPTLSMGGPYFKYGFGHIALYYSYVDFNLNFNIDSI